MNLEIPLVNFIQSGKQLKYAFDKTEPGFVGLHVLDDLKKDVVYIEGPIEGESYYKIPAISLTNENEHYDPEFILLWLPNEQLYGTWDCDHWHLYVFNNTTWNDVIENPAPYINCQWDHSQAVGTLFDPTKKYTVINGWPI